MIKVRKNNGILSIFFTIEKDGGSDPSSGAEDNPSSGTGDNPSSGTGDNTSSIDRILEQGFDGVYLDNIDSCIDSNWEAFDAYWKDHGGIPE